MICVVKVHVMAMGVSNQGAMEDPCLGLKDKKISIEEERAKWYYKQATVSSYENKYFAQTWQLQLLLLHLLLPFEPYFLSLFHIISTLMPF